MWSPVQTTGVPSPCSSGGSPIARCKHAMCVTQDGHIYLFGGRSANLPLKDLWRFDSEQNQWEEVKCRGNHPPNLQEHTMTAWNNKLYVFGGEIGFSSNGETPLWILDLASCTWKKLTANSIPLGSSGMQPSGRRCHSVVVYGDAMHIYGGYQDLRGSSSDLWTFDFVHERWHLMSSSGSSSDNPPPRHTHSAVVHDKAMWIYGGMTDLNDRGDFWKWSFETRRWTRIKIKSNKSPGDLHGHTAIKAFGSMFIFGGERSGSLLHELWRYHFATETWERINAEGVIPNSRCLHTAVANPFIDLTVEENETNNKVLRLNSANNCHSNSNNHSKALTLATPKSISMCFGHSMDTPLHVHERALKPFRSFRVHPMSALCSGKSSTISDDDDDIEEPVNGITNENYGNDINFYNQRNAQVTMKKSLREKLSHSRLVRSISSGSYNILHQNGCSAEALKDELEHLVEKSTPVNSASNDIRTDSGILTGIGPNKPDNCYRRLKTRTKMQKSMSSDAVLESDSESSTPQHHSNRPLSEVIQIKSIGVTPLQEEEIPEEPWSKRHTIHESMSYYSLCFPSPPQSKCESESSPTTSVDNNVGVRSANRLSGVFDGPMIAEFDEYLEDENESQSFSPGSGKENAITTLIDLDDSNTMISPVDTRPKSSGYDSLVTLYTPSVENRGIPHSMSHSSGYQSFTDESLYDNHKDYAGTLQTQSSNVIPRRSSRKISRELSTPLELKHLNAKMFESQPHNFAENGIPMIQPPLRLTKESRARSWDRASTRKDRGSVTPGFENSSKLAWQPQVNAIKEVIVPGSPASRKWSYSPAKSKLHRHHWQLCMYVFGGKEKGVSGIYKQPLSVWKLYI